VTVAVYVLVVLVGALALLLLGAQVEMYRGLEQLRDYAGLIDRPTPVDLGRVAGQRPSEVGLPVWLDSATRAVVLFLSDKCATCRSIAAALEGSLPPGLVIVVDPGTADAPEELSLTYELDPQKTVIDLDRRIMRRLGQEITPLGLVVENGRLARASTVPSTRQLYTLLEFTRPQPFSGILPKDRNAILAKKEQV